MGRIGRRSSVEGFSGRASSAQIPPHGDWPACIVPRLPGGSAPILGRLNITEAIEIARDWVDGYASEHPEYRGAHLMGSVARAPRDSLMASDSDVDVSVLIEGPTPGWIPIDELHRGVAIEAGLRSIDEYRSAETVLASPDIADHIVVDSILDDPTGLLREIQPVVAREFARQQWVIARCMDEKRRVRMYHEAARVAQSDLDFLFGLEQAVLNLSGLIAIALLQTPTHRKSFVNLRVQLSELGRIELAEEALAICGVADFTLAMCTSYLATAARTFDRALEVKRTPFPLDFKLKRHLRPYLIDGPRWMIDSGHHREAMPWVGFTLIVSCLALQNDAPEDERAGYASMVRALYEDTGFSDASTWHERLRRFEALRDAVYALADDIVASRPDELVTA